MKNLIIIALVAIIIVACNDPKDPPDDEGIIREGDALKVDTSEIVTKAHLQKVLDSLSNN